MLGVQLMIVEVDNVCVCCREQSTTALLGCLVDHYIELLQPEGHKPWPLYSAIQEQSLLHSP